MLRLLRKYRFSASDINLPGVRAFYCGEERWEREVAEWIKSPSGDNSVLADMQQFGIEVWLYRTDAGDLVGFSSLGENTWSFPPPKGPKHKISYIPFIGVHRSFWGEPKDEDQDDKFAYQILDDLIEYAATKTHLFPVIGLSVDQENKRAIKLYQNRDFVSAKTPRTKDGVTYERMFLDISSLVATPAEVPPVGE